MTAPARTACFTALSMCLFGGTLSHAGTEAFNNENLFFVTVPYHYFPVLPDLSLYADPNDLYLLHSPADNAAGLGAGVACYLYHGRFTVTSSSIDFDSLKRTFSSGTDLEFALLDTAMTYNNGLQMADYQPLVTFTLGDTIDGSDFAAPFNGVYRGPLASFDETIGLTPLLGAGAILGWRYTETGGVRYGFVRVEWFEDVPFERHPDSGVGFRLVDTYLPTAWGYSDTLDEGVIVAIPPACPADLDGNGSLNIDDVDAFAAAFLGSDLLADIDGNGSLNIDDVDAFVASFLAGC
jgi:hypothetical protein